MIQVLFGNRGTHGVAERPREQVSMDCCSDLHLLTGYSGAFGVQCELRRYADIVL